MRKKAIQLQRTSDHTHCSLIHYNRQMWDKPIFGPKMAKRSDAENFWFSEKMA